MDFAGRSLRTTSDAPSRSWKCRRSNCKSLVEGTDGFYLMLTLPPPARNNPARVAKPMTLGPILRTIAAIHIPPLV